jgi:hypothetical protein
MVITQLAETCSSLLHHKHILAHVCGFLSLYCVYSYILKTSFIVDYSHATDYLLRIFSEVKDKGEAIPLQAWTGP